MEGWRGIGGGGRGKTNGFPQLGGGGREGREGRGEGREEIMEGEEEKGANKLVYGVIYLSRREGALKMKRKNSNNDEKQQN